MVYILLPIGSSCTFNDGDERGRGGEFREANRDNLEDDNAEWSPGKNGCLSNLFCCCDNDAKTVGEGVFVARCCSLAAFISVTKWAADLNEF